MLKKWFAYRIYESILAKQGQIKPKTVSSYIFALKSYHIDYHHSLEAFDIPHIALIIKSGKRLFPKQKATCLPIKKDILEKITENEPINFDKLNIDKAFKLAQIGYLCLREIIYTSIKLKKTSFLETKVTRCDVLFLERNQYIVLCLKQSKTDIKYTGAQIILMATGKKIYSLAALIYFYILDTQPAKGSLFYLPSDVFSYFNVMTALKKRISVANLAQSDYFGHKFHKNAA